jgi:protein HOOK3
LEELENTHRLQIKAKEEEVQKLKRDLDDMVQRYYREQKVLLSVIHKSGMKTLRNHLEDRLPKQPTSWLKIQRATFGQPVVSTLFARMSLS